MLKIRYKTGIQVARVGSSALAPSPPDPPPRDNKLPWRSFSAALPAYI